MIYFINFPKDFCKYMTLNVPLKFRYNWLIFNNGVVSSCLKNKQKNLSSFRIGLITVHYELHWLYQKYDRESCDAIFEKPIWTLSKLILIFHQKILNFYISYDSFEFSQLRNLHRFNSLRKGAWKFSIFFRKMFSDLEKIGFERRWR